MKKYTVTITQDYEDNKGNVVNFEIKPANSLEEAEAMYEAEFENEDDENGLRTFIELFESDELEEGDELDDDDIDLLYNQLKSDYLSSKSLPEDGVIVYYSHVMYMNYCYKIEGVELVSESRHKTFSDLPYSEDRTGSTWAYVASSVGDLQKEYADAYHRPFDRINSGNWRLREFLGFDQDEEE